MRKIIIINNKTQAQYTFENSEATTLGELKREMDAEGIDYEDMTFFEAHMRAELKDNNSPFPTEVPYKGQMTSDLTFLLTRPEKKIQSGATMTRKEVYEKIKALSLQEQCVSKLGKNFTQCKTDDLIDIIEGTIKSKAAPTAEEPHQEVVKQDKQEKSNSVNLLIVVRKLLATLVDNEVITALEAEEILEEEEKAVIKEKKSKVTKASRADIEDLFDFISK